MEEEKVRIGSIVIDCNDFARMIAFWQDALHYVPGRPPTPGDPFVILKDPAGKGPNVSIDQMEPERGRLHLASTRMTPREKSNGCFTSARPATGPANPGKISRYSLTLRVTSSVWSTPEVVERANG